MTSPLDRPEARAAAIQRDADLTDALAKSIAAVHGMTDNDARAYLARRAANPRCVRHACPLPCNRCEAEMDAIDPWRDDDMSEGDVVAAERRYEAWLGRDAS